MPVSYFLIPASTNLPTPILNSQESESIHLIHQGSGDHLWTQGVGLGSWAVWDCKKRDSLEGIARNKESALAIPDRCLL